MKIYIITRGDYSDYTICGATLDKDRAELLRRFYSTRYDQANIEEYETDDEPEIKTLQKIKPVFTFGILENGKLLDTASREYYDHNCQENIFRFSNHPKDNTFYAYVIADDYEHAKKIAYDTRAKMLAEKFGL